MAKKKKNKSSEIKEAKQEIPANDYFERLRKTNAVWMEFIGGDENIKSFRISAEGISLIIEIDVLTGKVIGGQVR